MPPFCQSCDLEHELGEPCWFAKDAKDAEIKRRASDAFERRRAESDAWRFIDTRSADAHAYCQKHLMPKAWGRNVWHAILDDAIQLRNRLAAARDE